MREAVSEGTSADGIRCPVDRDGNWIAPEYRRSVSIEQIRGSEGLRRWENCDVVPRETDAFQERLFCIRWIDPQTGKWVYRAPDEADLAREERVLALLYERFDEWQAKGYIPSRLIEPGYNTNQPIRERGWTHWHHLFNPRQLLMLGLFSETIDQVAESDNERLSLLLCLNKLADRYSRLCRWDRTRDQTTQTFYNQALNTLVNYGTRSSHKIAAVFFDGFRHAECDSERSISVGDARTIQQQQDIWITDPGYGDVVHYDEISEFFLAWSASHLGKIFPDWYTDSKRVLNIGGEGEQFRLGLTEAYRNLASNMSPDGYQVVMFTHKDPEVWADVGLMLWAAGLKVSAAWTIQTETGGTGIRQGNYVQGTVCLVLRKRTQNTRGYLSDIHPEIQQEVRRQIKAMIDLDDREDPNFGDADYDLAAYAAALRVLTSYSSIDEIDVDRELGRPREQGVESPITKLIKQAVRTATDEIMPDGMDKPIWRRLSPEERLYLRGIEIEAFGESREGAYQNFARSYGVGQHGELFASTSANAARFKTPTEFGRRDLGSFGESGFGGSLLRRLLYAVYQVATSDERDPHHARVSLRTDVPDYWAHRQQMIALLGFLIRHGQTLPHWSIDVEAMRLLQVSLEHDAV